MHTRIGLVAGLVVAALCTSVTSAQPPGRPAATTQACPPSNDALQLCLGYRPPGGLGRSLGQAEYAYQFHDPYLATITAGAMNPDGITRGVKREAVHVPLVPDRDRLPMLEGRGEVRERRSVLARPERTV